MKYLALATFTFLMLTLGFIIGEDKINSCWEYYSGVEYTQIVEMKRVCESSVPVSQECKLQYVQE